MCMLLLAGFGGCNVLHDDMSTCNLYLEFRYDYNLDGEDWFAEQVEQVHVYVFNDNGFIQRFSENGAPLQAPGYRMELPYTMKGCTVVVWAGLTADHYELPVLTVGDPIQKLTLRLRAQHNASASQIAPLWYSGPAVIAATEKGGTTQTVSLIRDTNDLAVSVIAGSTVTDPAAYEILLTGANGAYDFQNTLLAGSPQITYTPALLSQTVATLYTLRLVKGAPLLFSVKERASKRPILIEGKEQIDLTQYLLQSKGPGMGDQEYLDRRYLWDIKLGYDTQSYMAISITINGWVHWFQNTDL